MFPGTAAKGSTGAWMSSARTERWCTLRSVASSPDPSDSFTTETPSMTESKSRDKASNSSRCGGSHSQVVNLFPRGRFLWLFKPSVDWPYSLLSRSYIEAQLGCCSGIFEASTSRMSSFSYAFLGQQGRRELKKQVAGKQPPQIKKEKRKQ